MQELEFVDYIDFSSTSQQDVSFGVFQDLSGTLLLVSLLVAFFLN